MRSWLGRIGAGLRKIGRELFRFRRDGSFHATVLGIHILPARRLAELLTIASGGGTEVLSESGFVPARPRKPSVLFLHHCYYNYYYLAKALRARGWDAVSLSVDAPDSPDAKFWHGEDLVIHEPDNRIFKQKMDQFLEDNGNRFGMVQFCGMGRMSLFPDHWDTTPEFNKVPWDFLAFKQRGVKIGYTSSGCLDGIRQSSFRDWSGGACDKCMWETRPDVCSDLKNTAWGHKVASTVDLYATEGNPRLDYQGMDFCYSEPLTQAIDADFWSLDLAIPEQYRIDRKPGEIIVVHSVGNFETRADATRNIKGTPAVVRAIENLQRDGIPIRLAFFKDVPSRDMRFIQAQADIVVDQLNFGRYGSTSREALMLGRPVVCNIRPGEPAGQPQLVSLAQSPIQHADEISIEAALRRLAADTALRHQIGLNSRAFAEQWFEKDACAARFEDVYAGLHNGETAFDIQKRHQAAWAEAMTLDGETDTTMTRTPKSQSESPS
jgi:glycosyltransferase involved in cell wall biosynthesis